MNNLLLSKITKDFLNLDPLNLSSRERYRLRWGGSILSPHFSLSKEKNFQELKRKKAGQNLLSFKDSLSRLFSKEEKSSSETASFKSFFHKQMFLSQGEPLQLFSKGFLKEKGHEPIQYLLSEEKEGIKEKPLPGNMHLFRSLCKGEGVLKKGPGKEIYLEIQSSFIESLFPYLEVQGLMKPPYLNFFEKGKEGAHIPVISEREALLRQLEGVFLPQKSFSFQVKGLFSSKPVLWPEIEEVWFFQVYSEELEDFRQRHFLSARPNGHLFHIAVAIRKKTSQKSSFNRLSRYRVNPSFLVA